jgi:hypothetical protein
MKLGIVGLPGAGKSTIFEALTKNFLIDGRREENRISAIRVPDERVDVLSRMFTPRKTIYAQVEYFLPGTSGHQKDNVWTKTRDCDALIHVIRNFQDYGMEAALPYQDFIRLNQELILSDLVVVEKRLERLELDQKRGLKVDQEGFSLLNECRKILEGEKPLRKYSDLSTTPPLKGYAFLSAKPMLVLFNNEDEDDKPPQAAELTSTENMMVVRGRLEHELAQLAEEEAEEFLTAFGITDSAMDRVIKRSYELLGLISFFTVVNNEVRAWTITHGTEALDAAGVIHTDMKKGFIRAEVVTYSDLMDAGSYKEARNRGTVRLEGKTYVVQDGDIIHFRFNV